MPVSLHDTLTRQQKVLSPADGRVFRFYCCGPTVYGPAHIGNFRTFLVQDLLRRVLEVDGLQVKHVRNITDVDDKTIRRSQEQKQSLSEFTSHWTRKFHQDCAALNMLPPHVEPKATEHIDEQIQLIQKLIEKGHAYQGGDGSVYFKVSSCTHYGELSHLNRDQLRTQTENSAGEYNDADEYDRETVSDFALWKARKPEDGENFWPSPWGEGRPGWHIECSAMSMRYLGESFDLHGGGVDLCFPHHENEIAQSECGTGTRPFCHHWFHSAHLMVEGKKMSKSLGNLYTLDDLTAQGYSPMVIRYALISGHYRQQLNFTFNGLKAAQSALHKLEKAILNVLKNLGLNGEEFRKNYILPSERVQTGLFAPAWEALQDDLNVPTCLGEMFSRIKQLEDPDFNRLAVDGQLQALGSLLYALGLDLFAETSNRQDEIIAAPAEITALAEQRWQAKKDRNFALADSLRDQIAAAGWKVVDRKDGFSLEKL